MSRTSVALVVALTAALLPNAGCRSRKTALRAVGPQEREVLGGDLPASAREYHSKEIGFQDYTRVSQFEMDASDLAALNARLLCRLGEAKSGPPTAEWHPILDVSFFHPETATKYQVCSAKLPSGHRARAKVFVDLSRTEFVRVTVIVNA